MKNKDIRMGGVVKEMTKRQLDAIDKKLPEQSKEFIEAVKKVIKEKKGMILICTQGEEGVTARGTVLNFSKSAAMQCFTQALDIKAIDLAIFGMEDIIERMK